MSNHVKIHAWTIKDYELDSIISAANDINRSLRKQGIEPDVRHATRRTAINSLVDSLKTYETIFTNLATAEIFQDRKDGTFERCFYHNATNKNDPVFVIDTNYYPPTTTILQYVASSKTHAIVKAQ